MLLAGQIDYAHYSFKVADDAKSLEGSYHEDGEFGASNEMAVRILFDDTAGTMGEFQLAKKPSDSESQPEYKTAFDFKFRKQNDGRFYLSDSEWKLGGALGSPVQFVATDDAFVFTKMDKTKEASAWTAARRGAPRFRGTAQGDGKRTMLQRWGWYIAAAMAYFAYKAAQEKVAAVAAGAGMKKA